MRKNALKKIIADGGRVINGWLAIPSAYSAEVMCHQGFDAMTIDMQHGAVDYNDAVNMLTAISTTNVTPLARVPWNEPGAIMKLLDAGAYGIICPMVNTVEEAKAFVQSGRYAPAGGRSFGPNRAALYGGADYFQGANEEVLLIAMIETGEALKNLEKILAVKGIDGVYVGPSDLAISLGKQPSLGPTDSEVIAAILDIGKRTRKAGKIAGIHTDGAKTALKWFAEGYQLCTLASDARFLANGAMAAVKEARGEKPKEGPKTY